MASLNSPCKKFPDLNITFKVIQHFNDAAEKTLDTALISTCLFVCLFYLIAYYGCMFQDELTL